MVFDLRVIENQDKNYHTQFFACLLALILASLLHCLLLLNLPMDLIVSLTIDLNIGRAVLISEKVVVGLSKWSL